MLIVTHEMGFARDAADRVVFMDAGQLVEDAPPQTSFTAPETHAPKPLSPGASGDSRLNKGTKNRGDGS